MKSFVAEAEITIDEEPESIFARLADVGSWPSWMPASFLLTSPVAARPAQVGDRFRVKILGSPFASPLEVSKCEAPRLLAWTGGQRGMLTAEHRFALEPLDGGKTRVRSIETWQGTLAPLLRFAVKPLAERLGREQLEALAKARGNP